MSEKFRAELSEKFAKAGMSEKCKVVAPALDTTLPV
jgi:hypothetical protein